MWHTYSGPTIASDELISVTTSRLLYVADGYVVAELGVMRPNGNFSPPYLWLVPLVIDHVKLRSVRAATNLLHDLLGEPIVFAECASRRDEHFLRFCGFTYVADLGDRLLVQRVRT